MSRRLFSLMSRCQQFNGILSTILMRVIMILWGTRPGKGFRSNGRIRLRIAGKLKIGPNVRFHSGRTNYVGGDRRMAIWVGPRGTLEIGKGCALSNSTIVCQERIEILDETFIGGGCDIFDNDFHALSPEARISGTPGVSAPIKIGPKAFLGSNVLVLKGVTIGEAAVVGAGSVVTKDVPAGEIWAGVPARPLGRIP